MVPERLMEELSHPDWSYKFLTESLRQLRTVHNHPIMLYNV